MTRIYLLLLTLILIISSMTHIVVSHKAEAVFFNVGQGDSYAFKTNDNRVILIDGGPDWTSLYCLGRWLNYFEREIDTILLTHTHSDHITALPEIIKRYKVKKIILPHRLIGPESIALLDSLKASTEIIYPEKEFCFDFNPDCYLCVLPPSTNFKNSQDDNNLSLATYFNCSGLKIFGAGDAPSPREKEMMSSKLISTTDILKISHHGSKYSSSIDFLNFISPKLAIISAGKNNRYKHPHSELIHRLEEADLIIWRTDIEGSALFYTSNKELFSKQINW